MTLLKKHCRRILKQYGKHIKAFEEKDLEPSDYTNALWNRILAETKVGYLGIPRKGLDLNNHLPMISILLSRYGFVSRQEDNKISSYEDIVAIAEGSSD